jgi:hypothetical protein
MSDDLPQLDEKAPLSGNKTIGDAAIACAPRATWPGTARRNRTSRTLVGWGLV